MSDTQEVIWIIEQLYEHLVYEFTLLGDVGTGIVGVEVLCEKSTTLSPVITIGHPRKRP